jgi:bifunctional non-homologous end joining protein LigD
MRPRRIVLRMTTSGHYKEYRAQLLQEGGGWVCRCQYGKIGAVSSNADKCPRPSAYYVARDAFDKVVSEKRAKGYVVVSDETIEEGRIQAGTITAGTLQIGAINRNQPILNQTILTEPVVATRQTPEAFPVGNPTGLDPQLLTPIDEAEVERYLADDAWCAQEKKDGERVMVRSESEQIGPTEARIHVIGSNRRGLERPLPEQVVEAIRTIPKALVIDGELVNEVLWAFDLLEYGEVDLRERPYSTRQTILARLLGAVNKGQLAARAVTTANTTEEKRQLLAALREAKAEGIVFKKKDSVHSAGRGKDWIKFKFCERATCVVMAQHPTKRSISIGLRRYLHGRETVAVGNCTIPVNFDIPAAGTLVEIRYMNARLGGSLYQPVYLGPRTDKTLADLSTSLKFKQENTDADDEA